MARRSVEDKAGKVQLAPCSVEHGLNEDPLGVGCTPREPGSGGLGYRLHAEGTPIAAARQPVETGAGVDQLEPPRRSVKIVMQLAQW